MVDRGHLKGPRTGAPTLDLGSSIRRAYPQSYPQTLGLRSLHRPQRVIGGNRTPTAALVGWPATRGAKQSGPTRMRLSYQAATRPCWTCMSM